MINEISDSELQRKAVALVLRVLTSRLILVIGMVCDFALFCWAAFDPSYLRLIGAAAFALFVLAAKFIPE